MFFPAATYAYENVSIKEGQPSLEVSLEVTGSGRRFHITTYISNTGDEQMTITLICLPGGGFEIYNQNEEMVYITPKVVFWIVWDLTLDPGQTEKMYSETWTGVDDYGKKLPCGDYSVRGVVFAYGEYIFGEPVNIHLEKVKNMCTLEFLNYFPLLVRVLSIFNFV